MFFKFIFGPDWAEDNPSYDELKRKMEAEGYEEPENNINLLYEKFLSPNQLINIPHENHNCINLITLS